jgi:hypothetical protein
MSDSAGKSNFRDVYREQYQEVSASKTSRVFSWIRPVALLVVAVLAVYLGHGGRDVLSICLGAAAVVLFVVLIVLMRRKRS